MVFDRSPTVIGHRGLGAGVVEEHAENTLASFLAAVEVGADWVEVDVRRTSDGRLVVFHDPVYGDGRSVVATDAEDARSRGALLLDELLEALPAHVGIDFDLKTAMEDALLSPEEGTVGLLAPVAAREAARRPVAVVSFDPAAMLAMRALAPGVATGWTTWVRFPVGHAVAAAAHLDVQFLGLHKGSVAEKGTGGAPALASLADALHHLGKSRRELLVWCPTGEMLRAVVDAGADAVCVNDVRSALVTLGRIEDVGNLDDTGEEEPTEPD